MNIELRFFAALREYLPEGEGPHRIEVSEGSSIGAVLDHMGVPPDRPRILLRNGVHATRDESLADGDVLSAFPPVAGG